MDEARQQIKPQRTDEQTGADALPESLPGSRPIWAGGVAIAVSLWLGHPYAPGGGGVLAWGRTVTTAGGLVAIGLGLRALLTDRPIHAVGKAALVAAAVSAVGAFAFFGVDQVPPNPPACSAAERPALDSPGPVYCLEGNGTLLRMSIDDLAACPAGDFSYSVDRERRMFDWPNYTWHVEWNAVGCPL